MFENMLISTFLWVAELGYEAKFPFWLAIREFSIFFYIFSDFDANFKHSVVLYGRKFSSSIMLTVLRVAEHDFEVEH